MDKFDLVYKKYKDLPIDRTIFMSLIVTVLREKKMHTLDSNISEDIIFMNEMDKEITIYLKNQIEYYNDIDSEIYLIEKYKYVFLLPKINEITFSNVEKEKMSKEEKEKYDQIGIEKIKEGKLAVVTMAGGQGTRLGHNGPKGTFDIGLESHKSIF